MWRAFGVFLEGWATAASGAPAAGSRYAPRRRTLREQNVLYFDGLLKIALAEAEARAGDLDRACDPRRSAGDMRPHGLPRVRSGAASGARRNPAEARPREPRAAEEAFLTAIAVAKQQGTRSFELRAALSLAKLYQSTGRPADAHAVLAPALEGFSPTPEMPEIAEAQALLAALAETEEVKAAEARQRRLLHLQTAYGQAMMMAKGYAAEETRAAFARATELAGRTHDFSKRFAALMGQYAAASTERRIAFCSRPGPDPLARSRGRGTGQGSGVRKFLARLGSLLAWRLR